jgi:uncharacterized protein YvpB
VVIDRKAAAAGLALLLVAGVAGVATLRSVSALRGPAGRRLLATASTGLAQPSSAAPSAAGPAAGRPATPPGSPPTPVQGLPARHVLAVPLFGQLENLSCEAASLQMALAYLGHPAGQLDILRLMNPDYSGVVTAWGDPYVRFVGDPNGHEYDHTGYGVYYPVVARVASAEGAAVLWAGTGLSWPRLAGLVAAGHPLIVWIAYDGSAYGVRGPLYSYRAFDGQTVPYAPGYEHTVVVAGLADGAVLLDNPRWGWRAWLDRADFEAAIAPFGRMAVALG